MTVDKHSKTILIIGANGFLGSNILQLTKTKAVRDLDYQFLAADIENSNVPIDVTFYHINITNPQDTLKTVSYTHLRAHETEVIPHLEK